MMFKIKPAAENLETTVLRPSRLISVPTIELVNENLLAQFLRARNLLACFAFRDKVDRRFKNQVLQRQSVTGWVSFVQPIRNGSLGLTTSADRLSRILPSSARILCPLHSFSRSRACFS